MSWKYSSDQLNEKINEIDGGHLVKVLANSNEPPLAPPYFGWFWRSVNWDLPIRLAYHDNEVCFCESNKWGYNTFLISLEDTNRLRGMAETLVDTPNNENRGKIVDFMLSLKPEGFKDKWVEVQQLGGGKMVIKEIEDGVVVRRDEL